ncbi:MAG: copper transporter [Coriobacteriia bacterium]|nr:copper transporter [Coriobacteriia bacterium]
MYNFRYHLITIVSIFVSLLIGLLLGAAITGSDLVKDTQANMVKDLESRFSEFMNQNDDLTTQLSALQNRFDVENTLAETHFEAWAHNRLDGRTVVLLVSSADATGEATREINDTLQLSGAATVKITVKKPQFGLQDPEHLAQLEELLGLGGGTLTAEMLALRLADEWTYVYAAPPAKKDDDKKKDNNKNPAVDTEALAATMQARYPLTKFLLEKEIISVDAQYAALSGHTSPAPDAAQKLALEFAGSHQMPYGANGIINTLVISGDDESFVADEVGLQLASQFKLRGTTGSATPLAYPAWLKDSIPKNAAQSSAQNGNLEGVATPVVEPSYYALLIDLNSEKLALTSGKNNRALSRLAGFLETSDRYSLIALLSGAQTGDYGIGRQDGRFYPALPTDATGRAPFTG